VAADGVDDLHAAEEFAARAVEALRSIARGQDFIKYRDIDRLVAQWDVYCRPTCGARAYPLTDACLNDTCGCPCGHADAADEEPPERELPGNEP
jgi:hypothetical protein